MPTRLGIIEKPEFRLAGKKILPMSHLIPYRENGAGRHIVETNIGDYIDKSRNTGIMRENSNRIIIVIECCDDLLEYGDVGVIQIGDLADLLVLPAISMRKIPGRRPGPLCRTGNETVDDNTRLDQTVGHLRSIPFTPVIERTVDIANVGTVPAAFGVPHDQ